MRLALAVIAAVLICERSSGPRPPVNAERVDFQKSVLPILEKKCSPCHFEGGVMHARLPFDKPETTVKLGTKLFSRIKDEESRATIRKFLADHRNF